MNLRALSICFQKDNVCSLSLPPNISTVITVGVEGALGFDFISVDIRLAYYCKLWTCAVNPIFGEFNPRL